MNIVPQPTGTNLVNLLAGLTRHVNIANAANDSNNMSNNSIFGRVQITSVQPFTGGNYSEQLKTEDITPESSSSYVPAPPTVSNTIVRTDKNGIPKCWEISRHIFDNLLTKLIIYLSYFSLIKHLD